MPLVKSPHFLSNPHETWKKQLSHEVIIFTKFHEERKKCGFFTNGQVLIRAPFLTQTLLCTLTAQGTAKL